jgi:hypothetical protein
MGAEDRLKIARQNNRRTHRMTGRNIGRQDSKRQDTVCRRDFNRKMGADDRLKIARHTNTVVGLTG